MIPLEILKSTSTLVFHKLHIDHTPTETFFKKAAKYLHNGTIPFFCAAVVTIACIAGAVIAGLVGLLLSPFVITVYQITKKISAKKEDPSSSHPLQGPTVKPGFLSGWFQPVTPAHYPTLQDLDGPQEGQPRGVIPLDLSSVADELPELVTEKNFPLILHRSKERTGPPPQKLHTWPTLNAQGTNHLSEHFLHNEVTMPGSDTTYWGLFKIAGTPQGYQYLDEYSPTLVPLLFPSTTPSPLNKKAPLLSRDFLTTVQTDVKATAKYIALLSIQLQYWGLSLASSSEGRILITKQDDFEERAAAIKKTPQRELLFQQVLSSLSSLGFRDQALQLAIVLAKNAAHYDIDPANIQHTMNQLHKDESTLKNVQTKAIQNYQKFVFPHKQGTDYPEVLPWNVWRDSLPSCSMGRDPSQATSWNLLTPGPTPLVVSTLLGWDGETPLEHLSEAAFAQDSSLNLILQRTEQADDVRLVINKEYLQTPKYLCAPQTEETLIQRAIQKQKHTPPTENSTVIDMEHPQKDSVFINME